VTVGLGVGAFLLVVNDNCVSVLHGYGDTGPKDFVLYWLRDLSRKISCKSAQGGLLGK